MLFFEHEAESKVDVKINDVCTMSFYIVKGAVTIKLENNFSDYTSAEMYFTQKTFSKILEEYNKHINSYEILYGDKEVK